MFKKLKMPNSSDLSTKLPGISLIVLVVGLLFVDRIIEPKLEIIHFLLCVLIAAVLIGASAVVIAIREAIAAIREASQLKVDKRHSEAVPPLSSDDEELDLSKTEES